MDKITNIEQLIEFFEVNNVKDKFPISTRKLHEGLEIGRDYTTWIKGRINKYDFKEGVDYTVVSLVPQNGGTKRGGDRRSVDYKITINMAKELSMVENNSLGHQYRQYFLMMEDYLKETQQLDLYNLFRDKSASSHHNYHEAIGNDKKCIALDKEIYKIVSYKLNSDILLRKQQILDYEEYKLDNFQLYETIKNFAYELALTLMKVSPEHYAYEVIGLTRKHFIDDEVGYLRYIKTHKTGKIVKHVDGFGEIMEEDEYYIYKII